MNTSTQPPGEHGGKTISDSPERTETQTGNQIGYQFTWHWHVLLGHFPTAAFLGSYAFMILHLITETTCFELSAFIALISGAALMLPTTISGWITWKKKYKGARGKIFINKIRIAFAILTISIMLVVYRVLFITENLDIFHNLWHFFYFTGSTLLFIGALTEGYFGGRLNHR